ncbi:MAG TPA: RdgB/HAM1 family non-canonical purine NTP pyrophosphatase [Gemmatimonadaceae bacterium]
MRSPASILATRSAGKLRELRPLFRAHGLDVIDLVEAGVPETAEEDGLEVFETFEENALAKARYFFQRTGRPTFADDSGLEVAALNSGPGVRSKRWSGRTDLSGQALDDENNRRLVEVLRTEVDRRARYVCAAAYADAAGSIVVRGETRGEIVDRPRGENGFGYDPFFQSHELGRTFGEATREEKELVSHRGRAFRALLDRLDERGGATTDSAAS